VRSPKEAVEELQAAGCSLAEVIAAWDVQEAAPGRIPVGLRELPPDVRQTDGNGH
jgi:hypothetical protein